MKYFHYFHCRTLTSQGARNKNRMVSINSTEGILIMKNFVAKIQKDFASLQKTLEKESDVVISRIKAAASEIANNKNVAKKRKEIEKIISQQRKKLEPAVSKFFKEIALSAKKYGIDVSGIETGIKKKVSKTKSTVRKKTGAAKKTTATIVKKATSASKKKSRKKT